VTLQSDKYSNKILSRTILKCSTEGMILRSGGQMGWGWYSASR